MSVTAQDLKNVDRNKPYADFRKDAMADPVKVMNEAAALEMSLGQYGNFVSPETLLEQKRTITARLGQDEGLFTRNSEISKASLVEEYLESPFRVALLQDILYRSYYGKRTAITVEASSPVGAPLLPFSNSQPAPVESGLALNPGELIADSHEVGTDNYQPFKWDYSKDDDNKNLKRHNVNPGATIPPTTLGQKKGVIQMEKWGNRFILPYETLTGNNVRINKLAAMTRLEGMTEEGRLFAELCTVLEKGDGTSNSAAEVQDQDDYDGTAPGANTSLEVIPFLNWIDEAMEYPFQITHVLLTKKGQRSLRTGFSSLTGNMALIQLNSIGLAPDLENMEGNERRVRYGRAPSGAITEGIAIGIDYRAAVEFVNRSGMAIRQQADNISNESREVVISDTYLWAKLALGATKAYKWGTS